MIPEESGFHLKYEDVYTDKKCLYSTNYEDTYCEIDIMEDGEIRTDCYLELMYDLIQAGLVVKVDE